METKVLLTPVDELVGIVKENPNCQVGFLAKKLELPVTLIEKWLVVLEEFRILNIQYKGFEGFVNVTEGLKKQDAKKEIDVDKIKSIFVEKSKAKGLSITKMQQIWPSFLRRYEGEIKELFYKKAKKAGFEDNKVALAWSKYREELNNL